MSIIEAKNIHRRFGEGDLITYVLKGIDITVEQGEFVAIMGKSGAGKSTLMYQLSALDEPSEGEIIIDGINKEELLADIPTDAISKLVTEQRQAVALPFWGIAGLGLLLGISFIQPLDFVATIAGGAIAIAVQKWGWKLQAKQLVLRTLEDIEERTRNPV